MTIAESERITRLVDCAMTIDAEGRITSADDGFDHLLGLRSSEVRGRPLSALVHPADLHETMAVLERHRTSPDHRERSMVLRCKHRDGSWRACEAPIRMASDLSGGVIIGLRGLGKSDPPIALTEAVDELATRSGIATRYDCVMIVDRNGIINLVEDRVNCALGHDPDDVVGHGIWEYVHPDEIEAAAAAFAREIAAPDNREPAHVFRCRHADGTWRWCEVPGRNRLDEPTLRGVVIGLRDVGPPFGAALWGTLTAAEQEVVIDVSAGLSNQETAVKRFTSVRTVETQLGAIYRKLGVTSRSQLGALARQR
jgi:PAS domain S-box-containing protein